MARSTSTGSVPLHSNSRLVGQPDRVLLQHSKQAGPGPQCPALQAGPQRTAQPFHRQLQPNLQPVHLDQRPGAPATNHRNDQGIPSPSSQKTSAAPIQAAEGRFYKELTGRCTSNIDDLWQAMYNSSYWRNGPVLNNAISGVDQALWDIKGRQAGMPVYQLLGGKCREAADLYIGVNGSGVPQMADAIRKAQAQGYRHFRFNVGGD